MLMYKLKQDKDKSHLHLLPVKFLPGQSAQTPPRAAYENYDDPWALQGQAVAARPGQGEGPASLAPVGVGGLGGLLTIQQALSSATAQRHQPCSGHLAPRCWSLSSLCCSQKHHWKQETRNKSVLPSWTSPQDHQLTPTSPFQHHLHRAAAALLEGSLPHTSAAVRTHWLTAGTATRKARGWGADLPRKASGAWLGLCETPIKPSSPDAFNCLIPRWS